MNRIFLFLVDLLYSYYFWGKLYGMNLQTVIKLENPSFGIDYKTRMLFVGSCFVENMSAKLDEFRFQTEINPCGVMYNPESVAETLNLLLEDKRLEESDLIENNGKWVSLRHHGSFSSVSRDVCLFKINCRLKEAANYLRKTDVLFITWGTAWVYRYRQTGQVAANCHRFPAADFERYRLSVEEIVEAYTDLLKRLQTLRPGLKVIFTVSPVRHWKDGANGNQLSKAILLLAIERLCGLFEGVHYFPAYELVMDEMRDYRFYGEDMLHLSSLGIEYIWEKFKGNLITEEARQWMEKIEQCNKILQHRPFDKNSEETNALYTRTMKELKQLLKTLYSKS